MENINNENIKKEVLRTVIWFDLFFHPLTSFEVFKFLKISSNYNEVLLILSELSSENKIINKDGFWCLINREEIIKDRFKRLNYFKLKIKRAKKFVKFISVFPFVRGVAVANIIGDHNLKKGSDVDLFIISSANKIWLCRFFCTFLAKILGLRPNRKTKQDKICLSFYVSEDNLNLEKYLYNNKDLYFIYWFTGLQPIFFKTGVWEKFWQENIWLKKYLPNFSFPLTNNIIKNNRYYFNAPYSCVHHSCIIARLLRRRNSKQRSDNSSSWMENTFRKIQLKLMPTELKDQFYNSGYKSTGVILSNNIIKLFLEDKRPFFIDQYEKCIKKNN